MVEKLNQVTELIDSSKKFPTEIKPIVKKSFIALTSLIGSGIIAERIIVPLISTPLAETLKNKINSINNDNTRKVDKF